MTWTEGHLRGFIQASLRRAFGRYPAKYETLKKACVGRKLNKATGRMAAHYECASCKEHFLLKEVQIDHKKPVVDVHDGFVDWNTYVDRLFTSSANLQCLCITCHKKKSKKENALRRKKK